MDNDLISFVVRRELFPKDKADNYGVVDHMNEYPCIEIAAAVYAARLIQPMPAHFGHGQLSLLKRYAWGERGEGGQRRIKPDFVICSELIGHNRGGENG
jgi:hypothetical protein